MATSTARKTRIGLVAGVAAGVFSLGVAGTALATNPIDSNSTQRTSAHEATTTSESAKGRQARGVEFYKEYISAWRKHGLGAVDHLRDTHLTKHCAKEVRAWGKKHNGDGVLRARSLPKSVDGHGYIVHWPGGGTEVSSEILLKYQKKTIRLAVKFDGRKISSIARSPRWQTWPPSGN